MDRVHRLLPAALVAAVSIASSACAATAAFYQYEPAVRAVDQRVYARGYDEGRVRGESDARRNRSFDHMRHGDFRDADVGYRGDGDRVAYRTLFRQGFVAGYSDGYRRNARVAEYSAPVYPPRYGSPAAQAGYRDGYEQGRDDARGGDRYDPIRAPRYRAGDHDFTSRYGSRERYKREYRAAFEQGYERGYRDS
ncbi:MAG: hypothetical protein A3H97_14040 [Acidobacteria bacterium RIFCSPLOWO2_02_FULL_65_29]|nr:MAG: hypothetical protein A3H97_14040 [Acidobacteria bacterium RIFCSPLOWO2_02_FULL_65_29]